MKKIWSSVLIVFNMLLLSACGMVYYDDTKENAAYNEAIHDLFEAVDQKDSDAIFQLFSKEARSQIPNLDEKVEDLLSVYSGPTDDIGNDELCIGSAHYEKGKSQKAAENTCLIRSRDQYFFVNMEVVYESDDPKQKGITRLKFYTVDEYYLGNEDPLEDYELKVYAKRKANRDLCCVDKKTLEYFPSENQMDINDVKDFLKQSDSFSEFNSDFGQPNACWEDAYYYYKLSNDRYLRVSYKQNSGRIDSVWIVDYYHPIEMVYYKKLD